MRTNDNLVVKAVIMSVLALLFSVFLVIVSLTSAKRAHDLEVRLIEIEQETVITLQTIDIILDIFESVGVISEELARRQLGEVKE